MIQSIQHFHENRKPSMSSCPGVNESYESNYLVSSDFLQKIVFLQPTPMGFRFFRCKGCRRAIAAEFLGIKKDFFPCRFADGLFCRRYDTTAYALKGDVVTIVFAGRTVANFS